MSSSSCVLYVGAIPYNWDVEVIKSVVCGSGPIVDVRCMMDSAAKNKGFCFVEYLTPLDALNALTTLSKIKIEGRKKLRIELSKEGLRNNQHISKPTLKLNRWLLPANVILPNEMKNEPENVGDIDNELDMDVNLQLNDDKTFLRHLKKSVREKPDVKVMVSQMLANGMDLHQIAGLINQFNMKENEGQKQLQPQQLHHQQKQSQSQQQQRIPASLPHTPINASSYIPTPTPLMQSVMVPTQPLDTVSKTLSTIPPGVLIELLAKLKLLLSTPNPSPSTYNEAANILNENPKLAVAAAQALLLMGVVDLDVLQLAQQQHQQHQQQPQLQSQLQQSQQQQQQQQPQQPQQPQQQQQQQQRQQPPPLSTTPLLQQNPDQHGAIPPEWMVLPQHTVSRLLQLSRNEANLIFQVLQLSPQQIAVLPPNERNMANQIRSQYI